MKGEMICNVWQAIELVNGEFGIDANRNFKESDFIETHDCDTMNVSSEACIFMVLRKICWTMSSSNLTNIQLPTFHHQ